MMGVYGDFLNYFNELFRTVDFYESSPSVDGWTEKTPVGSYAVIILNHRMDWLKRKIVSGHNAVDWQNQDIMFSRSSSPIEQGWFFYNPDERQIHRVVAASNYGYVGGFCSWVIERVQGTSPDKMTSETVSAGVW